MKRLDEIRAREQAATKGPWGVGEDSESSRAWFTRPFPEFKGNDGRPIHLSITPAETEFIAHAREDVPWLLDLVRRQAAALAAVEVQAAALEEMAEQPGFNGAVGSALLLGARSIRRAIRGAMSDE